MKSMPMLHEVDPREEITTNVGDLDEFEVFGNYVLIGVYERPEKTKSGLIITQTTRSEDQAQGKSGLVLKMGPNAFVDDKAYSFHGMKAKVGDWVAIFVSDGRKIVINKKVCRLVEDQHIRLKLQHPDSIY